MGKPNVVVVAAVLLRERRNKKYVQYTTHTIIIMRYNNIMTHVTIVRPARESVTHNVYTHLYICSI